MHYYHNFDLSQILWYKIGGKAKYFLECENRKDIVEALDFIKKNYVNKIFVCGLGSNLIFADDYFDGAVIQIAQERKSEKDLHIVTDNYIEAFSGCILDDVIQFAFAHNLVGFEWAGGLPGTVGAAVRGNVGAFGGEIKDAIQSAEVLDYSRVEMQHLASLSSLTNEQLQFVYRGSIVKAQKNMIVISAAFQMQLATDDEITKAREVYERNKQYRRDHHPLEYPNCGSVFKNLRDKEQVAKILTVYPDLQEQVEKKWYGKVAVAALIERLGLKGYQIGNAKVSEKHALFIVNLGNAKAKDVLQIIADIQEKFQEKFGFQLETEVEIVK